MHFSSCRQVKLLKNKLLIPYRKTRRITTEEENLMKLMKMTNSNTILPLIIETKKLLESNPNDRCSLSLSITSTIHFCNSSNSSSSSINISNNHSNNQFHKWDYLVHLVSHLSSYYIITILLCSLSNALLGVLELFLQRSNSIRFNIHRVKLKSLGKHLFLLLDLLELRYLSNNLFQVKQQVIDSNSCHRHRYRQQQEQV